MNKTPILFMVVIYLLSPQAIPKANAQAAPISPPPASSVVRKQAEESVSEATRIELLAFYDKIKSINEECNLKREILRTTLSEEAKKILEDRTEERNAEDKNK